MRHFLGSFCKFGLGTLLAIVAISFVWHPTVQAQQVQGKTPTPEMVDGFRWVNITQEMVKNPFQVGHTATGEGVYACRVVHMRDVEIGKRLGDGLGRYCFVGSGGMERPYSVFEALVGSIKADWVVAAPGQVPSNAFRADDGHGPKVYLCRGAFEGGVHAGMTLGENCLIGWNGDELQTDEFEVLVPRN